MLRAVIACMWMGLVLSGCHVHEAPSTLSTVSPTPAATAGLTFHKADKPIRLEKTFLETKQGQRWQLEADRLDWSDANSRARAYEVTWYLLDATGKRNIVVKSAGADIDMEGQVVTFDGKVVAQRLHSQESLVAQHLVYRGKEKRFYGSQGVVWKRQGIDIRGQSLIANAALDKVRLQGGIRGESRGEDGVGLGEN